MLLTTLACAAGPSLCPILPFILRDTKTMADGEFAYSGCFRCADAVDCCHNAIAFYLIHKFTIEHHDFPSLAAADSESWNNYYLFGMQLHSNCSLLSWSLKEPCQKT